MKKITTSSIPPPPLDDPTISDPLECPPLRWGIIGCGRVSHDFTQALKNVPTATVVAAAARSEESAKVFAEKHGIESYYGSYDELLQNPTVDIVYVGNVHSFRRPIGEKCLLANKHVLLEKPFACCHDDASYLASLAEERRLFLMEGMWTRFFPAVEMARRVAFGGTNPDGTMEEGVLGEVVSVISDFNFNASKWEHYPSSFVYDRSLGGGSSLLVAPYPLAAATLFFDKRMPSEVKVVGQVDKKTGVDLQASIVLNFAETSDEQPALDEGIEENTPKLPGSGTALLSCGMLGDSAEETTVLGTKGRLTIHTPGHCPTRLTVTLSSYEDGKPIVDECVYDFPVPDEDHPDIVAAGGLYYPNSTGFAYEAAAVARCLAKGLREVPQFTLEETLHSMKMIDEIRRQLGVRPVHEN